MKSSELLEKLENKVIGNIYRFLYKHTPKSYKRFAVNCFKYADINIAVDIWFGFLLVYGVILAICAFFLTSLSQEISILMTFGISFGVFVVFEVFSHYYIYSIGEKRGKITEEVLPDALKLMASNIRSGLTPDKALMLSAREEFGPLEVQIRKSAKKSLSGESIQDSLKVIPESINSEVLRRTIKLISDGISRGGDLSSLLDSIAEDISRTRILKKEVRAQVMMYSIFIFFAAAIGGPILYSISSQLVAFMANLSQGIDVTAIPQTGSINLDLGNFNIEENFLRTYTIVSLVVTSIFGGLLMGILKGGTEKDGIRYIPTLLVVSLVVYFLSRMVVGNLFTSFVG